MGLNLKILKMSLELFTWRYTESDVYQTDHFIDDFVQENIVSGYDIVMALWRWKHTANAILFREISDILMF